MATTPKALALQVNEDTNLNQLYLASTGVNTSVSVLSFTNNTTTSNQISIYRNNGTSDFLQKIITLPGGIGKERLYYGFQRKMINGGWSIKIQAENAASFNASVDGREVEIDGS